MHGKKQFRRLLLNIILRAAKAALAIAIVFALTVALIQSSQAQTPATGGGWTEKVLHSFNPNGVDGLASWAGLIFDAAGNLYGTTGGGGTDNGGTVFELTPSPNAVGGGWTVKILYSFKFNGEDGVGPLAGLTFDAAGNLYGTNAYRGPSDGGTVFELTPSPNAVGGRWTEKVLHSFGSGTDGAGPHASMIFDAAGNLYGTTQGGGTYSWGTVFELTPTEGGNWTEKVLYSFNPSGGDGYYPFASLIFDAAGNLYGTTGGGGASGDGTVFELTPTVVGNWTEKVLHSFNFTDGADPLAALIFDAAGNLYGTTFYGGTYNEGTVFKLTPTAGGGWTEEVLHSFGNGMGASNPYAGLIFDAAGNLYGTTVNGGIYTSCTYGTYGCGTVFKLTPSGGGWTEEVLHSFGNGTDASNPYASLTFDAAGNLYGTTVYGGTYGYGTVFEIIHN